MGLGSPCPGEDLMTRLTRVGCVIGLLSAVSSGYADEKRVPTIVWGGIEGQAGPTLHRAGFVSAAIRATGTVRLPTGWVLDPRSVELHVTERTSGLLLTQKVSEPPTNLTAWGPVELKGLPAGKSYNVAVRASFRDPDGKTRTFETDVVELPRKPAAKGK
jgi:hypothetical protein